MEDSFATTPRIKGNPFDKRIGENRLVRHNNGQVIMFFGWYSEYQKRFRGRLAKKIWDEWKKGSYFYNKQERNNI